MPGDDSPINRNDLSLLLKSYENSITLNTTLLSQQKQLVEKQNQLLQDFHNCTATDILSKNRTSCSEEHTSIKNNITKGHHGLTIRFVLLFSSIIGTLITILVMLFLKLEHLDKLEIILVLLRQIKG